MGDFIGPGYDYRPRDLDVFVHKYDPFGNEIGQNIEQLQESRLVLSDASYLTGCMLPLSDHLEVIQ